MIDIHINLKLILKIVNVLTWVMNALQHMHVLVVTAVAMVIMLWLHVNRCSIISTTTTIGSQVLKSSVAYYTIE